MYVHRRYFALESDGDSKLISQQTESLADLQYKEKERKGRS